MSFLPFPATNTTEAVALIKQDGALLHEIVHGDENAEVLTENGLVPSVNNVLQDLLDRIGAGTGADVTLRPDLAAGTADIGGVPASRLSKTVIQVAYLKDLPTSGMANGQQFSVAGFYVSSTVGGGVMVWDSTRNKADHNGGTVIAPEAIAAWNGAHAGLSALLNWIGSGTGCYVKRDSYRPNQFDFGAVYDGATDNTTADAAYQAALLAENPNRSKRGSRVGLPVNSRFDLGQVTIWQGSGGVWSTGNNDNLSIGQNSLGKNTTGYSVTVFGYESGEDNTTGFNLTAMGRSAGRKNTTGANNSYFGTVSGNSNTTGSGNTAGGVSSLTSNVVGNNNTAFGFKASFSSTGDRTTSVGVSANELGTASDVCVFGYEAGQVGQGIGSCLFGRGAGINGTGSYNAGFGYQTQFATGNGSGNSSLGAFTLQGVANQSNNTAIGYQALQNNTASGNTALGFNAGLGVTSESNVTCIGANSAVTGNNQVQLGDPTTTVYAYGAVQNRSDLRDKLDVKALTDAHIAFFMDIEWKQYLFNYRENYFETESYEDEEGLKFRLIEKENDGSKAGKRYHIGAIAQQVEAAMKKHGVDFAGLQHHAVGGGQDVYSIGYQEFIGIQGEVIQRQQRQLNSIEARLERAGI